MRYVGDSIQLLCSDSSPCQGTSHAFYHYNQHTGQFELIHLGTHKLTINLTLKNAGEYSCVKECSWNVTNELKCYWNVIGKLYGCIQLQNFLISLKTAHSTIEI